VLIFIAVIALIPVEHLLDVLVTFHGSSGTFGMRELVDDHDSAYAQGSVEVDLLEDHAR